MSTLRLSTTLLRILVKDRVYYPAQLITDTIAMIIRCGILLVLYWYLFQHQGGTIAGLDYPTAAWSMFLYFCLMTLRTRSITQDIMRDITSGTIEILFSKPFHYLWYRTLWQIGSGLYSTLVNTSLGTLLLLGTAGLPATMLTPFFWGSLLIVLPLSLIIDFQIYIIVGLLAFWIEDVTPAFWIVDKTVMLLGGSYLPVALFPDWLYTLALWTPFGAARFVTHTVYQNWPDKMLLAIGLQVGWIIILGSGVAVIFHYAQRRVSVNGG